MKNIFKKILSAFASKPYWFWTVFYVLLFAAVVGLYFLHTNALVTVIAGFVVGFLVRSLGVGAKAEQEVAAEVKKVEAEVAPVVAAIV